MNNLTTNIISPLLRGLTYDGHKGLFIHFEDDGKKIGILENNCKDILILNDINISDSEKSVELIKDSFIKYIEKNNAYPCAVKITGLGMFLLGETYDDTIASYNKDRKKIEKSELKYDRNSVVKNKIAIVTGAAQGFGESIARELICAGCFVVIADLNKKGAEKLAGEINDSSGKTVCIAVEVNVMDEESVIEMSNNIVRNVGGVDIFIGNAGVLKAGSVKEMDLKTFKFVTGVNYTGYFLGVKHISKIMAMQNRGDGNYFSDIIQINSKSGLEGSNKNAAYAGSKFGGLGLTQSFALELIEDNIKVNSICPGNFFDGPLWSDPDRGLFVQYLNTGKVKGAKTIADVRKFYEQKVPMKRGCFGEDVIKAIFYVIEQRYETGQAIPVTGGQVMLK